MRGFSDAYGSWNTTWMSRRAALSSRLLSSKSGLPSNVTLPDVGGSRRRMTLPSVVLPQPDSPTRPSVSPSVTVKLTPSTARTAPSLLMPMRPPRISKCFTRSSTASRGAAATPPRATVRSALVWPELVSLPVMSVAVGWVVISVPR